VAYPDLEPRGGRGGEGVASPAGFSSLDLQFFIPKVREGTGSMGPSTRSATVKGGNVNSYKLHINFSFKCLYFYNLKDTFYPIL